jgi:hypothetical protein
VPVFARFSVEALRIGTGRGHRGAVVRIKKEETSDGLWNAKAKGAEMGRRGLYPAQLAVRLRPIERGQRRNEPERTGRLLRGERRHVHNH